jgi:hypothetical protein
MYINPMYVLADTLCHSQMMLRCWNFAPHYRSPPFRVLGGLAVRHALHLLMLVQLVAGLWYLLMVAGWISVAALLGHTAALPIVSVAGGYQGSGMLV